MYQQKKYSSLTQVKFPRIDVNPDDTTSSSLLTTHDNSQPNGSQTPHGTVTASLNLNGEM